LTITSDMNRPRLRDWRAMRRSVLAGATARAGGCVAGKLARPIRCSSCARPEASGAMNRGKWRNEPSKLLHDPRRSASALGAGNARTPNPSAHAIQYPGGAIEDRSQAASSRLKSADNVVLDMLRERSIASSASSPSRISPRVACMSGRRMSTRTHAMLKSVALVS